MKVVINKCYGGFSLSKEAYEYLGIDWDNYGYELRHDRTNPKLVQCVEELGDKASGRFANLVVIEIPDDVQWEIEEYDGVEWIAEVYRIWQ